HARPTEHVDVVAQKEGSWRPSSPLPADVKEFVRDVGRAFDLPLEQTADFWPERAPSLLNDLGTAGLTEAVEATRTALFRDGGGAGMRRDGWSRQRWTCSGRSGPSSVCRASDPPPTTSSSLPSISSCLHPASSKIAMRDSQHSYRRGARGTAPARSA